jgi:hypothetical protein
MLVSPTHKRTEGRAPVWGSEFITKAATLQGDSAYFSAGQNAKFWDLVTAWWRW